MSLAISRVAALVGASLVLVSTESSAAAALPKSRSRMRRLGTSANQSVKTAGDLAKERELRDEAAQKQRHDERKIHSSAGALAARNVAKTPAQQQRAIKENLQRARNAPGAWDNSPEEAENDELNEIERNFLHDVELQKQAAYLKRTLPYSVYANPNFAVPAAFLKKKDSPPAAKPMAPRTARSKVPGIAALQEAVMKRDSTPSKWVVQHKHQERQLAGAPQFAPYERAQEEEGERKVMASLKLKRAETTRNPFRGTRLAERRRVEHAARFASTLEQVGKLITPDKLAEKHLQNLERARKHQAYSWELETARKISSGEAKRGINKGRKLASPPAIEQLKASVATMAEEARSPPSLRGRYRRLSFDGPDSVKKTSSPQSVLDFGKANRARSSSIY